jgi:hypothetical protein
MKSSHIISKIACEQALFHPESLLAGYLKNNVLQISHVKMRISCVEFKI